MRVVVAAVIAVVLASCAGADHGDGAQCRLFVDGHYVEDPCDDGLYCSYETGSCAVPLVLGEACDPRCGPLMQCNEQCEPELICDLTETCQPPGDEGTACTKSAHCAAGLVCNQGYVPDDVTLGECHPPGDAGAPCSYTFAVPEGTVALGSFGCAPNVTCTAPAVTFEDLASQPADQTCTAYSVEDALCGFAGTCGAINTGSTGDPCLSISNCESGLICYALEQPRAVDGTAGFVDDPLSGWIYAGPWPGMCLPPGLPVRGDACATEPCAPGYLCNLYDQCQPRWWGVANDICGDTQTMALNDEFCGVGLHCEQVGSFPWCEPD